MRGDNYRAWDIDINAFPKAGAFEDQIKYIVSFGILAPSAHNCQPWEFSVNNNVLEMTVNQDRSLAESDPEGRQLFISLGCAIENVIIAARHFGLKASVISPSPISKQGMVAKISFQPATSLTGETPDLIAAILHRRSNRTKYTNTALPSNFIEAVQHLSSNDFTVTIVSDTHQRHELADIANRAQIEVMDQTSFREELSHYFKNNFTSSKIGMPGFTLGIPALISLIAPFLVKKVNLSRQSSKQDDALLKQFTPAFCVISSAADDVSHWLGAGRIFERIWLMADQTSLQCAPLAAPVQVGEYYKKIQELLGISHRPHVFFRIGCAPVTPPHSPRLTVSEVMKGT